METNHRVVGGDSRDLSAVDDDAVELVVTSPPYPMIEMWDDLFSRLDPEVGDHLERENGQGAFEAMHAQLDAVWDEIERVLVPGGIACINAGDATRTMDGSFEVYPNHARIVDAFRNRGFALLPDVLWHKPTNSGTKFMGSGMAPPNAYVTLEHEYVLVFRNGERPRKFDPGAERRYEAAYFWEERNEWFSDVWEDVRGEHQALASEGVRERSGAYPFAIPYRLVCMYSVYGDTVLDPFWGTGTTTLAAMVAGRNSVGCELDREFVDVFDDRVRDVTDFSGAVLGQRLDDHRAFVEGKIESGEEFEYEAENYEFPVTTRQEKSIQFYSVREIRATTEGYRATHGPIDGTGAVTDGDR